MLFSFGPLWLRKKILLYATNWAGKSLPQVTCKLGFSWPYRLTIICMFFANIISVFKFCVVVANNYKQMRILLGSSYESFQIFTPTPSSAAVSWAKKIWNFFERKKSKLENYRRNTYTPTHLYKLSTFHFYYPAQQTDNQSPTNPHHPKSTPPPPPHTIWQCTSLHLVILSNFRYWQLRWCRCLHLTSSRTCTYAQLRR